MKRLLGSCIYSSDPHYKSRDCLNWGRWTNQRRARQYKKVIENMNKLKPKKLKQYTDFRGTEALGVKP